MNAEHLLPRSTLLSPKRTAEPAGGSSGDYRHLLDFLGAYVHGQPMMPISIANCVRAPRWACRTVSAPMIVCAEAKNAAFGERGAFLIVGSSSGNPANGDLAWEQ